MEIIIDLRIRFVPTVGHRIVIRLPEKYGETDLDIIKEVGATVRGNWTIQHPMAARSMIWYKVSRSRDKLFL